MNPGMGVGDFAKPNELYEEWKRTHPDIGAVTAVEWRPMFPAVGGGYDEGEPEVGLRFSEMSDERFMAAYLLWLEEYIRRCRKRTRGRS